MTSLNPNFHDGTLQQGQAFSSLSQTVLLQSDGLTVSTDEYTMIFVGSNNTTASSRTFTLTSSLVGVGHQIILVFNTGSSTTAQLVNGGNCKLQGDWEPLQYDTLTLVWDGTYWTEVSRGLASGVPLTTSGTLSQANLQAINTPITLIAAPGAGLFIAVDEIQLFHDYATAAYTSGADLQIEYATSGTNITLVDSTMVTATSDSNTLIRPTIYNLDNSTGTGTGFDISTNANKAVQITAASNFADGNASNILKYSIKYHLVTLLT